MGIRIYRIANLKAMQNTNKKDQVSNSGEDRYIYTLEKELAYLTQCIATTFKKRMLFFWLHISFFFPFHLYFG